jgi:outer membrane protein TolC
MPARPNHITFATVTLALAAMLSSCSNAPHHEATAAAAPASDAPAPAPATSAAVASAPELNGTWHAGPAPYADVVAALHDAGLDNAANTVLQGNKPSSRVAYDLKIQGGFVLLTSTVDAQPQGVQDREAYTSSGQTITLKPIGSSCSSTFTWAVDSDRLTLDLSEDTCPDYEGTPDAAMMTALYTALPFQRVGG